MDTVRERVEEPSGTERLWAGHAGPLRGVRVIDVTSMIADIFADPQYHAREDIVEVDHPRLGRVPMPGLVPLLSRTPGRVVHAGPDPGTHNEAVLAGLLGLGAEEIETLRREGVV